MNICIVTDHAIGPTHGTGTLLLKYFSGVPSIRTLGVHAFHSADADPASTLLMPRRVRRPRAALGALRRLQVGAALEAGFPGIPFTRALRRIKTFAPDVLWVIVYGADGLRIARQIARALPHLPTYCSFWDLPHPELLDDDPARGDLLDLVARARQVDAISEPLAHEVQQRTGRRVAVENFFCVDMPEGADGGTVRPSEAAGSLVMIGNIWLQDAFDSFRQILEAMRVRRPDLADIVWYCHPQSLERLGVSPRSLPAGLTFGGHLQAELASQLRTARYCLVPMHGPDSGHSGYARFSLPSKVSELFVAGVPVLAIADPEAAFSRFIARTGTGITVSPRAVDDSAVTLLATIDSAEGHARMSRAARELAETTFETRGFRARLIERLHAVAQRAS